MIIETKNKTLMPHMKLIIGFVLVAVLSFGLGFITGYAQGWVKCVDFGLNFVQFDNVVDKDLIRSAVIHYKATLGGWAFDKASPWYVGK